MFKKVLIANRGEIARRVLFTCREMEIATVAVYSDVDRRAVHVLEADQAVCLGAADPVESYLNIDKIIAAARETHAEAIHPGYGFLSENAGFAERCAKEGLVFIGPPARVINDLGDKITARNIMIKGNVPVIPGMIQSESDPAVLAEKATEIGYPVMIKASAGGGGKGIRIVNTPEELQASCEAASREASVAFGDGTIYLEKFFTRAKHIEFQILADGHGNVVHVLERECSVQRRHQKIIEETPSPSLNPELRAEMGSAAVAAAVASRYVNAGTVEFLLDENNTFYFLEVNTRLQVEHPVTEMITGIDLVRQQLEIAAGNPLILSQDDIVARGHAIECRVYAEDPANNFMPSPGKIAYMQEPTGPGIRNDCGVYSGFEVPVNYDPILSKLVVHARDRETCLPRMVMALKNYILLGIKTPIPFLIDVLESSPFQKGQIYTDFIERHFSEWQPRLVEADMARIAFIVDEMNANRRKKTAVLSEQTVSTPFATLGGWRL
ncbi:MAG: acetyl-CoA carboxylase biotin carboxylase subunit [Deltaproteobacteria bacterium]|nr:acetyl-CoA carboxylase biotin carboxylase subunit [Deltaproteobacteria bacterium]MBW2635117.1 acetyl-CoA carboxylase biotin carboxylase subunit [Deltaproteobacteria bacterium]